MLSQLKTKPLSPKIMNLMTISCYQLKDKDLATLNINILIGTIQQLDFSYVILNLTSHPFM